MHVSNLLRVQHAAGNLPNTHRVALDIALPRATRGRMLYFCATREGNTDHDVSLSNPQRRRRLCCCGWTPQQLESRGLGYSHCDFKVWSTDPCSLPMATRPRGRGRLHGRVSGLRSGKVVSVPLRGENLHVNSDGVGSGTLGSIKYLKGSCRYAPTRFRAMDQSFDGGYWSH